MRPRLLLSDLFPNTEQMLLAANEQLTINGGGRRIDGFADRIRYTHFKLIRVLNHNGRAISTGQIA